MRKYIDRSLTKPLNMWRKYLTCVCLCVRCSEHADQRDGVSQHREPQWGGRQVAVLRTAVVSLFLQL